MVTVVLHNYDGAGGCCGGYLRDRYLLYETLGDRGYVFDPETIKNYDGLGGRVYEGAYEIVSEDFEHRTAVARMIDNYDDSDADDVLWDLRKKFREYLEWRGECAADDFFD